MKIKMEEEKNKDDGSLSFLNIPRDKNTRHFNCPEITQQKLTNLTFWVIDYMDGVSTKFGKDRALVMIKKKFFTNSQEIKYVLGKIKEMDKFPRKVTMRASGNRYYLE